MSPTASGSDSGLGKSELFRRPPFDSKERRCAHYRVRNSNASLRCVAQRAHELHTHAPGLAFLLRGTGTISAQGTGPSKVAQQRLNVLLHSLETGEGFDHHRVLLENVGRRGSVVVKEQTTPRQPIGWSSNGWAQEDGNIWVFRWDCRLLKSTL